jgi:site-specific DNA-adenine methylase
MSAAPALASTPFPALKAPFPWFGGKSKAAPLIWQRLGDVGNYVEPFAGSLATLLMRPHVPRIETVNDRDCYLANFWRAVQFAPAEVARNADWPVNECDLRARHRWLTDQPEFREKMLTDADFYDAKIAGWWVWGISQWIGAGWCSRPEWEGRGQGGRAPRGLNASIHLSSEMGVHHRDGQHKRPVIRGSGVTSFFGPDGLKRGYPEWQGRPHLSTHNGGIHQKRPHLSSNGPVGVHSKSTPIENWMFALADRLRRVRVCCGDWSRIVTPSCTWKLGGGQLTGVLLDPPYSHEMRDNRLYSVEQDVSHEVREWAIENGVNRKLRIALCGLEAEHKMPKGWNMAYWKAPRGYGRKMRREVVWFSPYCLKAQATLFDSVRKGIAL